MTPTRQSLLGLAAGDALGKTWAFGDSNLASRRVPGGPWTYTDDTVMAIALVATLEQFGCVDQDHLAKEFATRFIDDPERGYGAGAYWLLHQLHQGRPWREVSIELFRGGSFGNGSAMRVAPLGAYYGSDLDRVCAEARASAEVTHGHPEGQAGAIATAIAAAVITTDDHLLDAVLAHTPKGRVYEQVSRVRSLLGCSAKQAAAELGDGREVCCHDTVPFALWCVASHQDSYEDAIFAALEGTRSPDADRDTVLAIVGGVVAAASPPLSDWVARLEPYEVCSCA